MIISFKHKGLETFFRTGSKKGIQARHAEKLELILAALDTADEIDRMDVPGWKLHQLKGLRRDIWSITVNRNWRVTFRWMDGDAEIVDYEDYH